MHTKKNKLRPSRLATLALLALIATAAPPVTASRLAVTPTRITLIGEEVATLTLRNRSANKVLVQARVYEWSQADGYDRHEPTREILVSPPIVELPPDADRVVRVTHPGPGSAGRELTYRLVLSEVRSAEAASTAVAIAFAIEFDLPVFVLPVGSGVAPQLDWSLAGDQESGWLLSARNLGTAHAQVRTIRLHCGAGEDRTELASLHRARYVLAGSSVSWPIAVDSTACWPETPFASPSRTSSPAAPEPAGGAAPYPPVMARIDEVIDVNSELVPSHGESALVVHVRAETDYGPSEGSLRLEGGGAGEVDRTARADR